MSLSPNIVCKAKNPETCRYHATNASQSAKERLSYFVNKEQELVDTISITKNINELQKLSYELSSLRGLKTEAQYEFDATPDGLHNLESSIWEQAEDGLRNTLTISILENRLRSAQIRLERAEECNQFGYNLIPSDKDDYEPPMIYRSSLSSQYEEYGAKYDSDKSLSSICDSLRLDILEAQEKGYLPINLGFTVTLNRGIDNSQQIHILIKDYNQEQVFVKGDYTKQGALLKDRVIRLAKAYQHENIEESDVNNPIKVNNFTPHLGWI